MAKKRTKNLYALLSSVVIVLAAVILISRGDGIDGAVNRFLNSIAMSSVYTNGPAEGEIEVHIIDVGQGDSVLIRSTEGNILIDAGTVDSKAYLKAYLDACGIKTISYFICSHPHDDHIGGADMILDSYSVETLLMPDTLSYSYTFEALLDGIEKHGVNAEISELGSEYTLGDITMKVLAPIETTDEMNNMSLVIKLTYGETSFVFTGDAEAASEQLMLEYYDVDELDCDFLKVGHHGSDTSSAKAFLEALSPKIAAVSCAKENSYGHPRGEVLQRLADSGCETILRTDTMGTSVVRSDGTEISVLITQQ